MGTRSLRARVDRLTQRLAARRRSWRITIRWHDDPPPEPRPGVVVVKLTWDERDSAELADPLDARPEEHYSGVESVGTLTARDEVPRR